MRYAKAIIAAVVAGLGSVTAAIQDGAFTGPEILTAAAALVIAGGATLGVPNGGFLDLSKLDAGQRAQLNRFLNLD